MGRETSLRNDLGRHQPVSGGADESKQNKSHVAENSWCSVLQNSIVGPMDGAETLSQSDSLSSWYTGFERPDVDDYKLGLLVARDRASHRPVQCMVDSSP